MTDLFLLGLLLGEAVMIAVGTGIATRVAFLTSHPPTGWVLLTVSFGLAMVRTLLFLYAALGPASAAPAANYSGQVLGFPIILIIMLGVVYLYRDFARHLRDRQKELLT